MSLPPWFKTSSLQKTFPDELQVTHHSIQYTLKSVFLLVFRFFFFFFNVLPFQTASLRALSLNKLLKWSSCEMTIPLRAEQHPWSAGQRASPACRCPRLILLGSNLLGAQGKRPDMLNTKPSFPGHLSTNEICWLLTSFKKMKPQTAMTF